MNKPKQVEIVKGTLTQHFARELRRSKNQEVPVSSTRYNPLVGRHLDDSSLFPSLAALRILSALDQSSDPELGQIVTELRSAVTCLLPRYRRSPGVSVYNFWQTHPTPGFFPNGAIFRHFRKFKLPEDADTTTNAFLSCPHTQEEANAVHRLLLDHANGTLNTITSTLPEYRRLPAFNTWFGTARMPVDFDVCIHASILSFLHRYGIEFGEKAAATIEFLVQVVKNGHHLSHPLRVSPSYATPARIIYHYARLISEVSIPELNLLIPTLRRDAEDLLSKSRKPFDGVLLGSSVLRLGGEIPKGTNIVLADKQLDVIPFYIADLLVYPRWAWNLAGTRISQIWFASRGLNLALLLEYGYLKSR